METPYYQYDISLLRKTLETIQKEISGYDYKVHYAIKANFDSFILKEISKAGFGADCVSIGEIRHAFLRFHPFKYRIRRCR